MKELQVRCQTQDGMFRDEKVVTVRGESGERSFFVDKSQLSQNFVRAVVLQEEESRSFIAIPGMPADSGPTRLWIDKQNTTSKKQV